MTPYIVYNRALHLYVIARARAHARAPAGTGSRTRTRTLSRNRACVSPPRHPLSFCRKAPLFSSRTCVRSNKHPSVGRTRTPRSVWHLGAILGVAEHLAAEF